MQNGLHPGRFAKAETAMVLKFLASVLIIGGSIGAFSALGDRPTARFAPMRYLVGAGLIAASWWFSRS